MMMGRTLSNELLQGFDYSKTKMNINNYFAYLHELELEQARLNAGYGLTGNYDFSVEYQRQPYIPVRKDEFNLSAKENNDEEIKKYLEGFKWAKSILTEQEQSYIIEYFMNGKYEDEIVDLLGFSSSDSRAFRNLKREAVYKFAYVLNLIVKN